MIRSSLGLLVHTPASCVKPIDRLVKARWRKRIWRNAGWDSTGTTGTRCPRIGLRDAKGPEARRREDSAMNKQAKRVLRHYSAGQRVSQYSIKLVQGAAVGRLTYCPSLARPITAQSALHTLQRRYGS
jgi:hypothetical protein